jgi:hypothetical protein
VQSFVVVCWMYVVEVVGVSEVMSWWWSAGRMLCSNTKSSNNDSLLERIRRSFKEYIESSAW